MESILQRLVQRWIRRLSLTRQLSRTWHRARILEELQERRMAISTLQKLSETSDVLFSIYRAQHDGVFLRRLPLPLSFHHLPVCVYMIAKFSLRWLFFRMAALLSQEKNYRAVCEVINPSRNHKLVQVAVRHRMSSTFVRKCMNSEFRIVPGPNRGIGNRRERLARISIGRSPNHVIAISR